ncbi:MAG TPA: hypothetical protein VML94_08025 [Thermoplasmata archaeon]|nr:hypothetical protein [Thermoplasmata archaeon]
MRITIPENLLSSVFPGLPVWATISLSALAAAVGGFCLSSLAHRALGDDVTQSLHQQGRGRVRSLAIFSGPTASAIGSLIGFVLGGAYGQFVGNPLGALGVGAANPAALRRLGVAAANDWTSTFLAGWIGSWVGQVTALFAFPYLPHGASIILSVNGSMLQIPAPQLFGYVVGSGVGLITWLGGSRVAVGSTIDSARAGVGAGLVWLGAVGGASLLLLRPSSFLSFAGAPFGVRGSTTVQEYGPVVPILIAGFLSLLVTSIVIPRLIDNQRNQRVRFGIDQQGKIDSIDVESRSALEYLGPGAAIGALLTILAAFAGAQGLGEWFRSWTTFIETVVAGALVGALLALLLGWYFGVHELTGSALKEMEQAVSRGEAVNPLAYADPFLIGIGELVFGMAVGLALAGLTFYFLEWRLAGAPIGLIEEGLVGGILLSIVMIAAFRRLQGIHEDHPATS